MKYLADTLNISLCKRVIRLNDEELLNEYEQFLSTLSNDSSLRDKELYSVVKNEILNRMNRIIMAYAP